MGFAIVEGETSPAIFGPSGDGERLGKKGGGILQWPAGINFQYNRDGRGLDLYGIRNTFGAPPADGGRKINWLRVLATGPGHHQVKSTPDMLSFLGQTESNFFSRLRLDGPWGRIVDLSSGAAGKIEWQVGPDGRIIAEEAVEGGNSIFDRKAWVGSLRAGSGEYKRVIREIFKGTDGQWREKIVFQEEETMVSWLRPAAALWRRLRRGQRPVGIRVSPRIKENLGRRRKGWKEGGSTEEKQERQILEEE